eukprot:scaffold912_cov119-Cylindrotheca_fusiformis.AAC.1
MDKLDNCIDWEVSSKQSPDCNPSGCHSRMHIAVPWRQTSTNSVVGVMPSGKTTKEHIPAAIGPLWRCHRHHLNDVEMLSLNVSPPRKGDQA